MSPLLLATLLLQAAPDFEAEIGAALDDVRAIHPVPANLVRAVIACESAGNPKAVSSVGAIGLMQVMPFNAAKVGLNHAKQLWQPRLNILAGVRLLAVLLKHYDGDLVAALVAYNAGPRPRGAPIPDNGETPDYVRCVTERVRGLERAAERVTRSGQ